MWWNCSPWHLLAICQCSVLGGLHSDSSNAQERMWYWALNRIDCMQGIHLSWYTISQALILQFYGGWFKIWNSPHPVISEHRRYYRCSVGSLSVSEIMQFSGLNPDSCMSITFFPVPLTPFMINSQGQSNST